MRIVTLDGKKLALELDWNILNAEVNRGKAIKQLLAEPEYQGIKRGLVLENEGQIVIGLADEQEKGVAPSAAAWLAEANRLQNEEIRNSGDEQAKDVNWIVIENLGVLDNGNQSQSSQESFWLSVIQDGLPLPGADLIMTWEEIIQHLHQMLGTQSNLYTVYSKDERIQNAFSSSSNVFSKGFSDLVKDVKFRKKIKALTGVPMPLVLGIVAVFVLILLYFAYDHFDKQRRLEEAQQAQSEADKQRTAQQIAEKAQYKKAVEEAVHSAYKQGLDGINDSLSHGDPSATLNAWAQIVQSIPLSHEGWQMGGILCDVAARVPECQVKLTRGENGINRTLVQHFPDVQFDGDNAFYVIRGSQLPQRENRIENIVGGRTLSLGLLSDLQTLRTSGIQYSLTASAPSTQDVTLPPKKAGPLPVKKKGPEAKYDIEYGVAHGDLTLQGDQIWQIRDLAKFVDSPALILKGITLSVSETGLSSSAWTMNFIYFIRTAPYPVLPSIPDADFVGGQVDPETGKMVVIAPGSKPAPDFTPGGMSSSTVTPVTSQGASENGQESNGNQVGGPQVAYPTTQQAPHQNFSAPVQGLPSGGQR